MNHIFLCSLQLTTCNHLFFDQKLKIYRASGLTHQYKQYFITACTNLDMSIPCLEVDVCMLLYLHTYMWILTYIFKCWHIYTEFCYIYTESWCIYVNLDMCIIMNVDIYITNLDVLSLFNKHPINYCVELL